MVPQSLSPRHSRPAVWPVLARLAAPFFLAGLVLVAWLLILSPPRSRSAVAAGTRRYVAPGGECGVPSPCYSRVQEAVNAATAGEEIQVAAGNYTDVVRVGNLTQTVFIDKNLTLRGGYVITDWETSRPIDRPTILDPQGLGRVIVITGPITVTIDGFVIRNGVAFTDTGTLYDGGGVYANAGTVMLENNVIYSNTADGGRGGAVYNCDGRLTVRDNTIYSNTAGAGGGVGNERGTLLVQRSIISGNAATAVQAVNARGGGLYNDLGTAALQNNLIYFNTSNGYGGGLSNNPTSTLTLQNDTIYSNTAVTSGGGALDLGTMTVTNAIIWGNGLAILENGTISVAYSDVYSSSGTYPGTGNLNVDPGVVDAAAGDFHLTATSPVSDVADPGTTLNEDLEGRARPWPAGGGYDMGAYEYYGPTGACFARLNGGQVYTSLQAAVDAASAGGLVQVAGHCVGVQGRAGVSQTVYVGQSLTVRGGYTVTDWINPRYGPTILDAQGQGRVVYLTGTGAITLEKLHITEGQGGAGAGVYIGPQVNARLQNNVIYRNDSTGLGGGIYNAGGVAWLQFNTVYSNTASAGGGIYGQVSGDTTLRDSIVAHNAASNSGGGIEGSVGVSLDYNNFYSNTAGGSSDDYGSVSPGIHDVSVDPQFSSSAAGDFHLQWTSQVIHAADPNSSLESDFEGEVRPLGPHSDIGADESLLYPAVDLSQAPNSPHIVTDTALIEDTVITFTHTFTNVGNTPSLTDTFAITVANNDGWSVDLVDITLPLALAAGASAEFKVVVSVPVTVSEPLFNQTVVTVTSTSNAAARDAAQDVIMKPGVELAPSYIRNADPGEVVTYTHTIINIGPSDTFTIAVASPLMWGRLVTPTGLVGLAHGETRLVVLRVRVTDTAPVNLADVMTVTATSLGYGVSDSITDTTIANPTTGSRYVRTDGTNTNNNCKDPDWPCAGIAYAVGQAAWGDTILVAEGTYTESGIFINQDLDLRGGYDSGFDSQGPPSATIIDAQNSGRALRVSLSAPLGSQPEINNFTIKNAQSGGVGGAVYLQGSSSPTLRDLVILDSRATRGGGIYIETGSPTLQRVTISGAQADDLGGGIYVGSGRPTIEDVTISHTTALSGGGIYNQSGHFEAEGLSLWDNTAVQGGGLYQASGVLAVSQASVANNTAALSGGGIYNQSGHFEAEGLSLWDNAAAQGGGLYQASGVLTISGASVASNTASVGGGLYHADGILTLWNNFIYSNTATAGEGGGVYQDGGSLSLVNDTLFGNQAATFGGGVFDRQGSWLGISNTIMVANTAITSGGAISCASSGSRALDYNAFWGNSTPASNVATGTHSLSADALFLDAAAGDLHLDVNSPAIDVGDPDTFLDTDIDGDIRPINQGFDIGADELAGCLAKNRRTGAVYGVVQEAIDQAANHDIIMVAGICRGVQSRQVGGQTLSQTAFIDKPLVLEGGYSGSFIYDGSTTTLDAEGLGRVVVITDTGPSVTVVISRLTLTGGAGAGLGGGVYNHDGRLDLLGSVITGNQAVYGGGVYNRAGSLFLVGSGGTGQTSVLSNTATDGGGVYLEAGTATLAGALLAGNSADHAGGGLYSAGGSVTLSAAALDSNIAAYGGGAYHAGGLWSGEAIKVAYNSAITGAGLYVADDQATLAVSLILSNTASGDGGGLHNAAGAALTMTNDLVAGNTAAGDGGGLHNLSSDLTVRHDAFYANDAGNEGGGVYHAAGSAAPVINSSLLVNNTAATGGGIHSANVAPTFAYNDTSPDSVSGFTPDSTNISLDPNFISTDPASGQFLRIPGGSAAEDVADPGSPVAEDIDGDPRPSNQGFDIGADEVGGCYVRVNGAPPTYGNIQVAAGHANDGNSLYVAGTCQGVNQAVDGGAVLSQTLFLTKSLTVQGGYSKDDWSVPHPIAQPTYLDALSLGRVVVVTGSAQVGLDGLHLTGGDAASGGGILVASGSLSMTGNWVYSNTATYGGGLYNLVGTVMLDDGNQVYSNTATDGGAVYNAGGEITLDDNTLHHNSASGNGGGFYHGGGTSLLQNNIIRGNQAANGGGIYDASTDLTVRHNTVYNNTANNGGGFYTVNDSPTLVNTLLISNTGTSGHAVYAGASYTPDYNDVYPATNAYAGSASAGAHSLTVDPLFVDAAGADFHLQASSPVVDKGDPTMTLLYDFEGDLRPGDQGFDMGADEQPSCRAKIVRTGSVYGNLQSAIDDSQSGDQILVTASECRGVHPFDNGGQTISQTVHITHSLTVVGGYQDDFLALSDPIVPTTLNPQKQGRAMLITGSTVVTLSNLYLTNGDAAGLGGRPGGGDAGGGLYYRGSGGTLSNLAIYSNTAAYGGGLFDAGSGLTVTLSLVQSNTASTSGGGIYNYNDALNLVEITVTLNTALEGGGIYNQNGSMYLAKNQAHHNSATGGQARGGGFYNADGASTLDLGNRFYNNTSEQDGGAIYNFNGDLKVWNTLIYGNSANDGAGLYVYGGEPHVAHNVFYNNSANASTGYGGGIYVTDNKIVTVTNSIFYQNTGSTGAAIYGEGGGDEPVLSYNYYTHTNRVVGVSVGSNNVIGPSPGLVNLTGGDFHLQDTSPLIDWGQTLALVPRDFENDPRPINVSSDIGADEYKACLAKLVSNGVIYGRIQAALDDANTTDEIYVATGECYESITVDKDITLSGSWSTDFSGRLDYVATTIDAVGRGTRVVTVTGDVDVSISQVELTNGTASGNGGGLWTDATQLTLSSVEIISNTATDGGGMYVDSGKQAVLNEVTIEDNSASGDGGGIYAASNSQVTIPGGGIADNQATGYGGGIYSANGSRVHVTGGAAIDGNQATLGGGVHINGAAFRLSQKRVTDNEAGTGGGIYIEGTSAVTMTNLGLYYNTATGSHGGGIYRSAAGNTWLYHATIHSNTASSGSGGGVYNGGSSMVISASIVASNSASGQGSGIYGAATVNVAYTLQWNNTYSGTVTGGGGNLYGDPQLRTPTGDLEYTSPAIDAVPSSKSHVAIDRSGQVRPDICAKDMGRDEYNLARQMNWTVAPLAGAGGTVPPTGSITYTFSIKNESQNLTGEGGSNNRGTGTGYTETVTATLNSTQGWGQIVSVANGVNPTVTDTAVTFEIGPGVTVDVNVRVTVPAGIWAGVQDVSKMTYQAWQCPAGTILTGESNPATTQASANRDFDIGPDNFGAAYPGQTVTYTHLVTNIGNIADTYSISPKAGWYASAEIVQPASYEIPNLPPGMTATVVMRVTIRPEAGAGLTDISSVIAQNSAPSPVQKATANNTVISTTTGTRYVALNGTDSLVDETQGNPDPNAVDYPDNNCTQPLVGPCRTIQQAIDLAAPGDTVKIAEGRYTDLYTITHASRLITQTAFVNESVMLQGGYQAINWEEDPPNHLSHTTTLDPQGQGRVIYVTQGVAPTLDRLELINGDADGLGPGGQDLGGNLYSEGAALTLNVMRVVSGSADIGGGLYHNDGALLVQNSLLYGSQAITGGALYVEGGTATILNNTFYNDTATDQGSAVYVAGGSLLVTNTIFATNTATAGAAVHGAPGATSVLDYNLFFNNVITHTGGTVGAPSLPNDVLADPRFVDPTAYRPDLYPGSGSPVREAGDPPTVANTGLMSWDYGNQLRRQGPRVDIGAYEYVVPPRVEFEPDVYTETTTTGGEIVFAHWLTNTGDITDTFTITYTGSLTWPVTILPGVVTLNTGAVSDVVVTVTVPTAAGGLTDQLVITATSDVTHTVYDTVLDTIFVVFAPQIEFAHDEWGTTGPLQTIAYTHRITNTGNGQDTYAFTPLVIGSLPLTVSVTPPQVTLPVGGSRVITVSVTPPGPSQAVSGTVGSVVISATSTFSPSVQHTVTDTTTISQVFGLDLAPDGEGSGLPGEGVPYHHILTQLGNYTQTVVLTYTTVPSWQVSLPISHTMSPGDAISITAVVTVPLDSLLGVTNVTRFTAQLATNPVISDTAVDTTSTGLNREVIIEPPRAQSGLPGQVVTYTHAVTNRGNATDRISITPSGSAFTSALVSSSPITLAAFASDQVTVTVEIPYLISGTLDVLTVTAASEFSPTTALDAVTDTTTVGHLPAVVFEPDRTGDGELGQVAIYTHTVTNLGNYTDTLALTYTANLTWPVVISPTPPGSIHLGINQSAPVTVSVTIAQGGFLHTALITASSESDANFWDRVMVTTTLTLPASLTLVAPSDGHITKTGAITFEWSPMGVPTYTLALNGTPYTVTTNISPTVLGEGVYTWTAASVDPFGRRGPYADPWTVTVDLTAPSVPTPTVPMTGTSALTKVVTFSWEPASDDFTYPLSYTLMVTGDGGPYVDTVHDFTSTVLTLDADGVYTWVVQAIDSAGNESGFCAPVAFFVDATPPLPPVLVAPANGTLTNTRAITFTWQDVNVPPVTTYTLHIADTAYTVTDTYSPTVLGQDGVYTWTVRAIDQFDRPSDLAATWVFTVDTTPPTTPSLTAPLSGTVMATTTVAFDWTPAQDALSGIFSYTLNAGGTLHTALSDAATLSLPGDGIYTWTVRAHDRAGNAGAYTDTWQVLIDMTLPSVPIPITPTGGVALTYTTPITLMWQASDDTLAGVVSYTAVVTDSGGNQVEAVTVPAPLTSTPSLTITPDGTYTWTVWAVDGAGNVSGPGGPATFVVDAFPPDNPLLMAPPDGTLTNTDAISFAWSRTEQTVSYTLHLTAGMHNTYSITDAGPDPVISPTQLADGVYTWTVEAIDNFARTSGITDTWVFTVDTTAPTVPVPTYPYTAALLLTSPVPFTWHASSDETSGVVNYQVVVTGPTQSYSIDAGTITATVHSLGDDGVYTWRVRAVDAAANASDFSHPITFTLDANLPDVPILQSPLHQSFTNDPNVVFTWSPSADTVTYTVDINGAFHDVLAPTTSMSFTSPLADGRYDWTVQAVDSHGLTLGYATPAWWVRVDTRPPAAPTLISPADGAVTSTHRLTLSWLAVISDTASGPELSVPLTYTLSISGQTPLEVTGYTAVVNLVTGFYTWTVWATDRAGNVGPSSQTFAFTVREPYYWVHLPLVLKGIQTQPGPTP